MIIEGKCLLNDEWRRKCLFIYVNVIIFQYYVEVIRQYNKHPYNFW